MKKILFPLLVFATTTFSQDANFNDPYLVLKYVDQNFSFNRNYYDDFYYDFASRKKRSELHINKIKSTFTDSKGKKKVMEMAFNSKGYPILSTNLSKNEITFKAEYQNDSLDVYRYSKYKKNVTEVKRAYTNGKKTTETKIYNGKEVYTLNIAYNSSGKISVSNCLKKGKNHKMLNTFNAENQLTKTEYFIDNELKKTWKYECKPQGEALASVKNEVISSKCEFREESNDGSYVVFTRTLIKGKPYLMEEKFTRDSVKFEVNHYKNDSILTSKWYKEDNWNVNINYRKGQLKYQSRYKTNDAGKMIEYQYIQRNKIISITKNKYDQLGNCILKEYFNPKKAKALSKTSNEFHENGTMKSSTYAYKGKIKSNRTYEYVY